MPRGLSSDQELLPAPAERLDLFRNLLLEAELLRVLDAFSAVGLSSIVLKGVLMIAKTRGKSVNFTGEDRDRAGEVHR